MPYQPLGTVEAIEAAIIQRRADDAEMFAAQAAGHVRDGEKWEDAATDGIGL